MKRRRFQRGHCQYAFSSKTLSLPFSDHEHLTSRGNSPNFLSPCSLHARETEVRFGSYNKLYFAFTIPLSSFLVLNLKSIVFINTCMTCMVLELVCNSCPGICIKGVCKAGIQSQGTSCPWRNGHWWAQIGTFFVMLLIVYVKKIHHREARQTKFWNGAQLFSLVFS